MISSSERVLIAPDEIRAEPHSIGLEPCCGSCSVRGDSDRALGAHHTSVKSDAVALLPIGLHRDRTQLARTRFFRRAHRRRLLSCKDWRAQHARCAPRKFGPIVHAELVQKRRDMKFNGPDSNVQSGGDLFVFPVADHGVQNLLLAGTQLRGIRRRAAMGQQFFGASNQALGKHAFHRNENRKVARLRPTGHTLHRQKSSGAFDRKIKVAVRSGPELRHTSSSFAENQRIWFVCLTRFYRLLRKRRTSLHVLPSLGFTRNWGGQSV
jgi:hypothetical protein